MLIFRRRALAIHRFRRAETENPAIAGMAGRAGGTTFIGLFIGRRLVCGRWVYGIAGWYVHCLSGLFAIGIPDQIQGAGDNDDSAKRDEDSFGCVHDGPP